MRWGGGDAGLQRLQSLMQGGTPRVAPERLEPPSTVVVEAQQMVIERELERGQPAGDRRARADRLQSSPELVAEIPEPPAPDRVGRRHGAGGGAGAVGDLRLLVEQRERVLVRRGDPDWLGSDQRTAAGPPADQRKRPLVVSHEQRSALRRECPRQRYPDNRMRCGARRGFAHHIKLYSLDRPLDPALGASHGWRPVRGLRPELPAEAIGVGLTASSERITCTSTAPGANRSRE